MPLTPYSPPALLGLDFASSPLAFKILDFLRYPQLLSHRGHIAKTRAQASSSKS